MLRLLEQAARGGGLSRYGRVWVKGHPDQPVKGILRTLRFPIPCKVIESPLSSIWPKTDVVFSANSTSVAIESSWIGKPTIVLGGMRSLNLNALFRRGDVSFVNNLSDLTAALSAPQVPTIAPDFLYFTPQFSSWKNLLEGIPEARA